MGTFLMSLWLLFSIAFWVTLVMLIINKIKKRKTKLTWKMPTAFFVAGFVSLLVGASVTNTEDDSTGVSSVSSSKTSTKKSSSVDKASLASSKAEAASESAKESSEIASSESASSASAASAASSKAAASAAKAPAVKDLSTGTWTAGKDFNEGYYKITSNGGSGNLQSDSGSINAILGQYVDNNLGQVDSYTGVLNDGDVLSVSGMQGVHLEPVDTTKQIDLSNVSAGIYLVGKNHIPAGRYTITAIQGSGNVTTDDGSLNEIMGTSADSDLGQVTTTTVNLHKNDILSTSLEQISLTKQ